MVGRRSPSLCLWGHHQFSSPNISSSPSSSFFFFFFSLLATSQHMKVPGQRSDPSCRCNLYCSYSNASSFNPLFWARDQTCVLELLRHHWFCCITETTPSSLSYVHFSISSKVNQGQRTCFGQWKVSMGTIYKFQVGALKQRLEGEDKMAE